MISYHMFTMVQFNMDFVAVWIAASIQRLRSGGQCTAALGSDATEQGREHLIYLIVVYINMLIENAYSCLFVL